MTTWFGPTTRRGDTIFLHLLMQPYDSVTVRGVPIKRVHAVRAVGSDTALPYTTRSALIDAMFSADPPGELTITVPAPLVDPYATVIAVDIAPAA
jgi:alpha-L-fucosidase